MHSISIIASVAALFSVLCIATPASSSYVLHEKRTTASLKSSIARRTKLDGNHVLPIRLGLTQGNLHKGHNLLMDVAHPDSANYGKHWTAEEVNAAFAPTSETIEAVHGWLIAAGIEEDRLSLSDNRGWLAFDASVEEAEALFRTQYYKHDHTTASKYMIGCDEYYLPKHIQAHVDYVTPGVKNHIYKRAELPLTKRSHRSTIGKAPPLSPSNVHIDAAININCSNYVVNADCLRTLYSIPKLNLNRKVNPTNTIGVYEGGDTFAQADLDEFFTTFLPFISNGTQPDLSPVDGAVVPVSQQHAGGESALDLSIIYSLVYPQVIDLFQVDDPYEAYYSDGFLDTFLDALDGSFCTYSAFGQKGDNNTIDPVYPDTKYKGPEAYQGPLQCGKYKPPNVISISYLDGESNLPPNYLERQCNEWMKLGLQGTTVLFASGDYGLAPFPNQHGNADGCMGNGSIFAPSDAVDCPYILAVGATQIKANVPGSANNAEEAVFSIFGGETLNYTSGGGFSNVFARPDYQKDAVAKYFEVQNPPYPHYSTTKGKNIGANGGLYNRAGRGYPDVSANGAWWLDYVEGGLGRWGGTSMATPIWASIINLINEDRLAAGKSPVGFVNPTLYANTWAFHDIVDGSNNGCNTKNGFLTAEGWDPVTGLGTPKYDKLHQLFMGLP